MKEDITPVASSSIEEQKGVARSGSRFWLPLLAILLLASVLRLSEHYEKSVNSVSREEIWQKFAGFSARLLSLYDCEGWMAQ